MDTYRTDDDSQRLSTRPANLITEQEHPSGATESKNSIASDLQEKVPNLTDETTIPNSKQSFQQALLDQYSSGCETLGLPKSDLTTDPQLELGAQFQVTRRQTSGQNSHFFNLEERFSLQVDPKKNDLFYLGNIQRVQVDQFGLSRILNGDDRVFSFDCFAQTMGDHGCTSEDYNFTQAISSYLTANFILQKQCQESPAEQNPPNAETVSSGTISVNFQKPLHVYVHRKQDNIIFTCPNQPAQNLIVTTVEVHSNDLVSFHRNRCGGQTLYQHKIYHDKNGVAIASRLFQITSGPVR